MVDVCIDFKGLELGESEEALGRKGRAVRWTPKRGVVQWGVCVEGGCECMWHVCVYLNQ